MGNWDNALGNFQPHIPGAPRAGSAGMGAGPIPYAPGATTYTPNTAPPTSMNQSTPDLPVNAGGRPPEQGMGQPPAGPPPSAAPPQQGGVDPMVSLNYMQQLYDWFMRGRNQIQR